MLGLLKYLMYKLHKYEFNVKGLSFDNLLKITEEENILYKEEALDKTFSSVLCWGTSDRLFKKPIILINKNKRPSGKWFLLGHELGHYFFHSHIRSLDAVKDKRIISLLDHEATYFSYLTLIPTEEIFKEFSSEIKDVFSFYQKEKEITAGWFLSLDLAKKLVDYLWETSKLRWQTLESDFDESKMSRDKKVRVDSYITQRIIFFLEYELFLKVDTISKELEGKFFPQIDIFNLARNSHP
jgi:hypothetical protein